MSGLPEGKDFNIGDRNFHFSVAKTGLELMSGLRGVTSFESFDGMLFDFGCNYPIHMTPKGLKFPVDVAFLDKNGIVLEFNRLDPENGLIRSASQLSWYALEVPVGFFDEHGIVIGSKISV